MAMRALLPSQKDRGMTLLVKPHFAVAAKKSEAKLKKRKLARELSISLLKNFFTLTWASLEIKRIKVQKQVQL